MPAAVHAYSLDAAENAANHAFPLLVIGRGVFLTGMILNALAVPASLAAGSPEAAILSLFVTLLGMGVFLWQLATLQTMSKGWMTFWAVVTGIIFVLSVIALPFLTMLQLDVHGFTLFPLFFALQIWLLYLIARGWLALAFLAPPDRAMVRPQAVGFLTRNAFTGYLGIPLTARFLGGQKLPAYTGYILGTFFGGLFFVLLGSLGQIGGMMRELELQVALLVVALVLAPILLAIGNTFRAMGRAFTRQSIDTLTAADQRPPLLFLRAFRDDQVALALPDLSVFARLLQLGRPQETLDSLLVEEGTPYGPVVALGNPGDPYPPYGAARGYFEHKDWQQAVKELLAASQAIVLCVDETEAVSWEIRTIVEMDHLGKALFLIPPKFLVPDDNRRILRLLIDRLGEQAPAAEAVLAHVGEKETVIALLLDKATGWEALGSGSFSSQAYVMALRRFLRGRLGEDVKLAAAEDRRTRLTGAMPANVARPIRAVEALMQPPQALLSVFDIGLSGLFALYLVAIVLSGVLDPFGYAGVESAGLLLAIHNGLVALLAAAMGYGLLRWIAGASRSAAAGIGALVLAVVLALVFLPGALAGPSGETYEDYLAFFNRIALWRLFLLPLGCLAMVGGASLVRPVARRPAALLAAAIFGAVAGLPHLLTAASGSFPPPAVGALFGVLAHVALLASLAFGLGMRLIGRPAALAAAPVRRAAGSQAPVLSVGVAAGWLLSAFLALFGLVYFYERMGGGPMLLGTNAGNNGALIACGLVTAAAVLAWLRGWTRNPGPWLALAGALGFLGQILASELQLDYSHEFNLGSLVGLLLAAVIGVLLVVRQMRALDLAEVLLYLAGLAVVVFIAVAGLASYAGLRDLAMILGVLAALAVGAGLLVDWRKRQGPA